MRECLVDLGRGEGGAGGVGFGQQMQRPWGGSFVTCWGSSRGQWLELCGQGRGRIREEVRGEIACNHEVMVGTKLLLSAPMSSLL